MNPKKLEPKFKVGDVIQSRGDDGDIYKILFVGKEAYFVEDLSDETEIL